MDPPAAQESPEPAPSSQGETREPHREKGQITPRLPPCRHRYKHLCRSWYRQRCPLLPPHKGTPLNKGTDNAPTSGRYFEKPLERAHTADPLTDQIFANGSSTSRPTSVRPNTDSRDDGRESLPPTHYREPIPLPHSDASVPHRREQRGKTTGERNATATPPAQKPPSPVAASPAPAPQPPPPPLPAAQPTPLPPLPTPAPPVAPTRPEWVEKIQCRDCIIRFRDACGADRLKPNGSRKERGLGCYSCTSRRGTRKWKILMPTAEVLSAKEEELAMELTNRPRGTVPRRER